MTVDELNQKVRMLFWDRDPLSYMFVTNVTNDKNKKWKYKVWIMFDPVHPTIRFEYLTGLEVKRPMTIDVLYQLYLAWQSRHMTLDELAEEFGITKPSEALKVQEEVKKHSQIYQLIVDPDIRGELEEILSNY